MNLFKTQKFDPNCSLRFQISATLKRSEDFFSCYKIKKMKCFIVFLIVIVVVAASSNIWWQFIASLKIHSGELISKKSATQVTTLEKWEEWNEFKVKIKQILLVSFQNIIL